MATKKNANANANANAHWHETTRLARAAALDNAAKTAFRKKVVNQVLNNAGTGVERELSFLWLNPATRAYVTKLCQWLPVLCGDYIAAKETRGVMEITPSSNAKIIVDLGKKFNGARLIQLTGNMSGEDWKAMKARATALAEIPLAKLAYASNADKAKEAYNALEAALKKAARQLGNWQNSKYARAIDGVLAMANTCGVIKYAPFTIAPEDKNIGAMSSRFDGSPIPPNK